MGRKSLIELSNEFEILLRPSCTIPRSESFRKLFQYLLAVCRPLMTFLLILNDVSANLILGVHLSDIDRSGNLLP